jgi:abortive infection bacteriophage resistance protein
MEYQKPPLSYDEQLNLLVSRGLNIDDRVSALACLRVISYYRLSAYYLPFKHSEEFRLISVNL